MRPAMQNAPMKALHIAATQFFQDYLKLRIFIEKSGSTKMA